MHTVMETGEEGEFPQLPPAEHEAEDEALAAVLASLGGDAGSAVRVYRQGPGGYRDVTFITEWLPSEYSETRLQNEFGGGHFRVHVRKGGGLLKNVEIKVAPPVRPRSEAVDVMAPVKAQLGELAAIVGQLAQAVARQPQPVPQPVQSRREMLEEMMLMSKIVGGGGRRDGEAMDMLVKILEAQKMLGGASGGGGGDGGEPGTMAVLMEALRTLGPVLQARGAQQMAPAMPAPQYDPAAPLQVDQAAFMQQNAAPASVPPPAPSPSTDQEAEMLKFYINMLINEAAQGANPEPWAMLVAEKLTREQISQLMGAPNWFEQLTAFEPKTAHHREWFSDMRSIVFEILSEDDAADKTGVVQPGNGNAPSGTSNTNTSGTT